MYIDLHVASFFFDKRKNCVYVYTEYVIHTLCISGISQYLLINNNRSDLIHKSRANCISNNIILNSRPPRSNKYYLIPADASR